MLSAISAFRSGLPSEAVFLIEPGLPVVVNVTDWAMSCGSGRDSPRLYARRMLVSGVNP